MLLQMPTTVFFYKEWQKAQTDQKASLTMHKNVRSIHNASMVLKSSLICFTKQNSGAVPVIQSRSNLAIPPYT